MSCESYATVIVADDVITWPYFGQKCRIFEAPLLIDLISDTLETWKSLIDISESNPNLLVLKEKSLFNNEPRLSDRDR